MVKRNNSGERIGRVTKKKSAREGEPPLRDNMTSTPGSPKERRLDILKGKFTVGPEFSEPLPEDELDAWEG